MWPKIISSKDQKKSVMNVFRNKMKGKKKRVGLEGLSVCLPVCLYVCLSVSAVCLSVAHWIPINDTGKSLGQSVRSGSIFAVITHDLIFSSVR